MGDASGGLCDICNEDVDKLFSYHTRQEVNIQDHRLGCTSMCLQLAMVTYIVLGIFYFGLGYLDFEQARGAVATHVRGDAVATSSVQQHTRYFSAEEITYPGLENGNVFVSTRLKATHQKRGVCIDKSMPCESDLDCTAASNGKCAHEGFCNESSWCADAAIQPEVYELEVGDLAIWVKSSIQFIMLAPQTVYSTETLYPYPQAGKNLFSVRELLLMCEPIPVRYEEVSELGAAIEVQFIWNCDVDTDPDGCKPEVKARRLDVMFDPEHIGYAFAYAEYVSDEERVLNEMRGVRVFLRTYGQGQKFSMTMIIMKLSTTCCLLGVAPILADVIARYLFGDTRRKQYIARVREESPDFSSYMENLEKKKSEAEKGGQGKKVDLDKASQDRADDEEQEMKDKEWQARMNEEN